MKSLVFTQPSSSRWAVFWPASPQYNPKDPLWYKTLLKKLKGHCYRGKTLTALQVTKHYISAESVEAKLCTGDLSLPSSSDEVIRGLVPRETPFLKICL